MGGQMGGHYTAYVKNDKANKWILYDDERVSIVENPASIITPQAYCLFYRIVS